MFAVDKLMSGSSKFTLMYPRERGYYLTEWIEVEGGEECSLEMRLI